MARSDSEELKIAKKSSWGPLFCDIKLLEVLKPVFLFSANHPTASYQQVQVTNNIIFPLNSVSLIRFEGAYFLGVINSETYFIWLKIDILINLNIFVNFPKTW